MSEKLTIAGNRLPVAALYLLVNTGWTVAFKHLGEIIAIGRFVGAYIKAFSVLRYPFVITGL